MKKLQILLVLLFVQIILAQTSNVTFFSEEGERFFVVVNGIRQNDAPGTNVVVTGLDKPNYVFRIIFENQKIPSLNKNIDLFDVDNKRVNATFVLRKDRKGRMQMRLSSFDNDVNVPTKQAQVVKYHEVENPIMPSKPNPTKEVFSENVDINVMGVGVSTSVKDDGENVDFQMNVGGLGVDSSVKSTTKVSETTSKTQEQLNPTIHMVHQDDLEIVKPTTTSTPAVQQTAKSNTKCRVAMNNNNFQQAKSSITRQSFTESQMRIAKQVIDNNCLSVNQIKELMQLFSFEASKLELAKYAFAKCTERGNYFVINDVFTFSSSVDELGDYIDTFRD